jgi:NADH-quinone oxidoreductase subunit H
MKLILSYELPFILVLLVPVIKSGGSLALRDLLAHQAQNGSFAWSLSGILALLAAVPCLQAKLALVPFDQAEAETEIMGGALIEYSGAPLAVFKLTKAMMLLVVPVFLVVTLWGGIGGSVGSVVLGVVKYLVLVVLVTLIRNTNPRLRIEHAMKFFWGPVSVAAVVAVVLALLGV